jgi:hypothetical protein
LRILGLSALAVAALLPASAAGAAAGQDEPPPQREVRVIVYGDDPCPAAENPDEIVVCGRQPEDERYRIPRELRERRDRRRSGGTAWGARVEDLEEAQRSTRPDGCSVVGSNGQTGCAAALARDWYRQRREDRASRRR